MLLLSTDDLSSPSLTQNFRGHCLNRILVSHLFFLFGVKIPFFDAYHVHFILLWCCLALNDVVNVLSDRNNSIFRADEGITLAVLVHGHKNCNPADMSQAAYLRYRKTLSLVCYITQTTAMS